MRRLLPLLVLVPLLGVAEEPKPNALRLFDGETTFGWKIDGEAKVVGGKLILGGKKRTKAQVTTVFPRSPLGVEWEASGDFTFSGFNVFRTPARGTAGSWSQGGETPGDGTPFGLDVPAGVTVALKAVRLWVPLLDMPPLFNGKDLTGWRLFKGDPKREKSKFTVADGVLTVKDGPGDLATEKLLDDFVLQFECKSNGKYLNSGIFFRAIPGEYQNGYEAQIQHDFSLETPKKYPVDEYDPTTGKKAGTREVPSKAKDFGTGAIYRRIPARKAMAKDGEWFTMTVVARGRHIATWVNGVQQVDWTDNRSPHDNPRNGYREKAGAISIQGHDPTTDLSFRNIRHVALPRK